MSSGRAEYIRNILKITDSTLYSENRNVTIVSNSGSDQDSDPDVYCVDEIIDTKNFNKNSLLLFGYFYLNQYKNDFSIDDFIPTDGKERGIGNETTDLVLIDESMTLSNGTTNILFF